MELDIIASSFLQEGAKKAHFREIYVLLVIETKVCRKVLGNLQHENFCYSGVVEVRSNRSSIISSKSCNFQTSKGKTFNS